MRVLIVTSPGLGHLFPTVPLAGALRAAGHEVRYATGGLSLAASDAGFDVVDVTPGLDYLPVYMAEDPQTAPSANPMFADDPDDVALAALFARVSGVMADGVVEQARAWRPNVIVAPPLQGAGRLAAGALGVPLVEPRLGAYDSNAGLTDMIAEGMGEAYRRHGAGDLARLMRITTFPRSFLERLPERRRSAYAAPMRYVPYNGGAVLPAWLLSPPARPRIAVTLGTVEAQWGGIAILRPLIESAADVDAEFVVTLGGGDAALLGELPANVRTVEWAPLHALLATSAAVIHHGGSGTTMTAVTAGIPQCVIPRGSYQQTGGDLLPGLGIGLVTKPEALGAVECRTLLKDEAMRDAARRARADLAAMPSPAAVVPQIEALVA